MTGSAQGQSAENRETGPTGAELRRQPRLTLLMRTAKLVTRHGEFLCIVRDASATGVRIQLFHPVPTTGSLVLELASGIRHEVSLVWEREGQAGLEFHSPIAVEQIINDQGPHRKRPVRLGVQLPALISGNGLSSGVLVRNLSQHGALIQCAMRLAIEQKLRIQADFLPVIQAKVRWRKGDEYGLAFDETFRFDELAVLISKLQKPGDDDAERQLHGIDFC